ncbi:MAG: hypothetical protein ACP5NC_08045, partial [Nitrososphaeria archaeon]
MNTKIIVLIIALFGMIVPISPLSYASVAPAHAGPNNTIFLQAYNPTSSYPYYTLKTASINVTGYAGNELYGVDSHVGASAVGYFDINLSGITISSGSVTLYVSANGQAQISSGDVAFATN